MDNHKGKFNMSTKILSIAVVFLLSISNSFATLMVDGLGNIDNLEVNGQLYDVDWNFGNSTPDEDDFSLFFGDQDLTQEFLSTVHLAFVSQSFVPNDTQQFFGFSYAAVGMHYIEREEPLNSTEFHHFSGHYNMSNAFSVFGGNSSAGWGNVTQRLITPENPISSEVPEPSSLAIFVLGLMGLASRRFKK
jgi:hypothetical protein